MDLVGEARGAHSPGPEGRKTPPTNSSSSPSSAQYCLRWNNYQTNLTAVFDQLLQNEFFVDVTLTTEGRSLKCHKVVLSACSPYFQVCFFIHIILIAVMLVTPF